MATQRPRTRSVVAAVGTRTASSSTSESALLANAPASMLPVAVDAMGGDVAPQPNLDGAHAAAALGIPVVLVGPEGLEGLTSGDSTLDLIHASEVIGMLDDAAQGVRRKKDSTLVRAAEAVRDGRASAMISAGNTGATMAAAISGWLVSTRSISSGSARTPRTFSWSSALPT